MPKELPEELPKDGNFYASSPYKDAFDIEYPQENLEGEMYKYRCKFCKKLTTDINGLLENHAEDCEYRLQQMGRGG
jgi:DNA-directed RNA polymerase subunit RPC12/RpoP